MSSQISSLTIIYSTVYSGPDQWKQQSSASLSFVQQSRFIRGNHWLPDKIFTLLLYCFKARILEVATAGILPNHCTSCPCLYSQHHITPYPIHGERIYVKYVTYTLTGVPQIAAKTICRIGDVYWKADVPYKTHQLRFRATDTVTEVMVWMNGR